MFGDQKVLRSLSPEILDVIRTSDELTIELLDIFEKHRSGHLTHAQFITQLDLLCDDVETAFYQRKDDGSDYATKDRLEGEAS